MHLQVDTHAKLLSKNSASGSIYAVFTVSFDVEGQPLREPTVALVARQLTVARDKPLILVRENTVMRPYGDPQGHIRKLYLRAKDANRIDVEIAFPASSLSGKEDTPLEFRFGMRVGESLEIPIAIRGIASSCGEIGQCEVRRVARPWRLYATLALLGLSLVWGWAWYVLAFSTTYVGQDEWITPERYRSVLIFLLGFFGFPALSHLKPLVNLKHIEALLDLPELFFDRTLSSRVAQATALTLPLVVLASVWATSSVRVATPEGFSWYSDSEHIPVDGTLRVTRAAARELTLHCNQSDPIRYVATLDTSSILPISWILGPVAEPTWRTVEVVAPDDLVDVDGCSWDPYPRKRRSRYQHLQLSADFSDTCLVGEGPKILRDAFCGPAPVNDASNFEVSVDRRGVTISNRVLIEFDDLLPDLQKLQGELNSMSIYAMRAEALNVIGDFINDIGSGRRVPARSFRTVYSDGVGIKSLIRMGNEEGLRALSVAAAAFLAHSRVPADRLNEDDIRGFLEDFTRVAGRGFGRPSGVHFEWLRGYLWFLLPLAEYVGDIELENTVARAIENALRGTGWPHYKVLLEECLRMSSSALVVGESRCIERHESFLRQSFSIVAGDQENHRDEIVALKGSYPDAAPLLDEIARTGG